MGILSSREMERIINLMSNFGLPSSFGKLQPAAVVQKMYSDKKSRGNVLQLVLPVAVGRSKLVPGVSGQLVESVLQEI
jgi:3-dehydroquinate synthetase